MRIIDITQPIAPGMPVYPGDPAVRLEAWASRGAGDPFNVTVLHMGTHTGTHIDAPAHCIEGGTTVEALSLDVLCGRVHVLAVSAGSTRWPERIPPDCTRLLLRTAGDGAWFGMDEAAARGLVARRIRLIGIDRLSIARADAELPVHGLLLAAGVAIVEGLALEQVAEGSYHLYCLPLALRGADGAPARAVLVEY
ncbi:MAG: cyclase family protein [Dehalococcoidia bacterium]